MDVSISHDPFLADDDPRLQSDAEDAVKAWQDMTVKELRTYTDAWGVEVPKSAEKDRIIELIEAHQKAQKELQVFPSKRFADAGATEEELATLATEHEKLSEEGQRAMVAHYDTLDTAGLTQILDERFGETDEPEVEEDEPEDETEGETEPEEKSQAAGKK
jgi:hypothetical protein